MDTYTNMGEIRQVVRETCDRAGTAEMADRIRVEWSGRFTARMGDATHAAMRVRLSRPLWPLATPDQRRQTIIHEVCHLIARELHGPAGGGHGMLWRLTMRRVGASPERCHTIDRSSVVHTFPYRCACRTYQLGKIRHARISRGQHYRCAQCGQRLVAA